MEQQGTGAQAGGRTGGALIMALVGVGMLVGTIPAAGAAELKVGYVNLVKVVKNYQRTQDSEQVFEQKGKQKQTELEGQLAELKKLRQNLELLNDQAKETKARELEEKSDEFKRLKERSERELLHDRDQVMQGILDEFDRAAADYAKANGFTIVLDQRSMLYADAAYDLSDAILKMLNDRYAASKAGAKR